MGVRRDDRALHSALDRELARRRRDIRAILREYGVPLIDEADDSPRAGAEPRT